MADYQSAYSGTQIDEAVGSVPTLKTQITDLLQKYSALADRVRALENASKKV